MGQQHGKKQNPSISWHGPDKEGDSEASIREPLTSSQHSHPAEIAQEDNEWTESMAAVQRKFRDKLSDMEDYLLQRFGELKSQLHTTVNIIESRMKRRRCWIKDFVEGHPLGGEVGERLYSRQKQLLEKAVSMQSSLGKRLVAVLEKHHQRLIDVQEYLKRQHAAMGFSVEPKLTEVHEQVKTMVLTMEKHLDDKQEMQKNQLMKLLHEVSDRIKQNLVDEERELQGCLLEQRLLAKRESDNVQQKFVQRLTAFSSTSRPSPDEVQRVADMSLSSIEEQSLRLEVVHTTLDQWFEDVKDVIKMRYEYLTEFLAKRLDEVKEEQEHRIENESIFTKRRLEQLREQVVHRLNEVKNKFEMRMDEVEDKVIDLVNQMQNQLDLSLDDMKELTGHKYDQVKLHMIDKQISLLCQRVNGGGENLEQEFEEVEKKVEQQLSCIEKQLDLRLNETDETMTETLKEVLDQLERKLEEVSSDMTEMLVELMNEITSRTQEITGQLETRYLEMQSHTAQRFGQVEDRLKLRIEEARDHARFRLELLQLHME